MYSYLQMEWFLAMVCSMLAGQREKWYAAADYCITMGALSLLDLSKRILSPRKFPVLLESAHNSICLLCRLASQGRAYTAETPRHANNNKKRKGVTLDLFVSMQLQNEKT